MGTNTFIFCSQRFVTLAEQKNKVFEQTLRQWEDKMIREGHPELVRVKRRPKPPRKPRKIKRRKPSRKRAAGKAPKANKKKKPTKAKRGGKSVAKKKTKVDKEPLFTDIYRENVWAFFDAIHHVICQVTWNMSYLRFYIRDSTFTRTRNICITRSGMKGDAGIAFSPLDMCNSFLWHHPSLCCIWTSLSLSSVMNTLTTDATFLFCSLIQMCVEVSFWEPISVFAASIFRVRCLSYLVGHFYFDRTWRRCRQEFQWGKNID